MSEHNNPGTEVMQQPGALDASKVLAGHYQKERDKFENIAILQEVKAHNLQAELSAAMTRIAELESELASLPRKAK